MPHQFDLLPVELQASVVELRQSNVPESAIDSLITRTLQALGAKSNRLQVEVLHMEERLGQQLAQIGNKLQSDLQTQHGATNAMLADLNTAWLHARPLIEEAGRGIAEIKKNWSELDQWRSRVEATLAGFTESRDVSKAEREGLKMARDESNAHRARIQEALDSMNTRLLAIEQLLELAGNHEAES